MTGASPADRVSRDEIVALASRLISIPSAERRRAGGDGRGHPLVLFASICHFDVIESRSRSPQRRHFTR